MISLVNEPGALVDQAGLIDLVKVLCDFATIRLRLVIQSNLFIKLL